jgi:hypothetical protein
MRRMPDYDTGYDIFMFFNSADSMIINKQRKQVYMKII